ncbi:MAG: glycosyltransferase family 39 protein [Candidatus Omnitrophota bacterium]
MNDKRFTAAVALIMLFSAYLFLFGLGEMALTDPDEPFYAETAKEMMVRGEWLTPRIFGEPQFEKPAFYYWLIILSYKIFGVNEFGSRFPSAVFGILGILGVYLLASRLFSRRTGLYASLVMATTLEYIVLARACVTDMVLCVFILYGFVFYLDGYMKNDRKAPYLLAAACFGGAVLTKGPVGLVLPAAIIFIYLIAVKDPKAVLRFPVLAGAAVFLAVTAPWYYLMGKVHGGAFIGHFFGFQNITRFLEPEHKIGDVFYYYIPIILGGFLPWSVFLPYGTGLIINRDRDFRKQYALLLIWLAVFFVFFSVSRTKLPTYIFPVFPALAVFMGRFWELSLRTRGFNRAETVSAVSYIAVMLVSMALACIIVGRKYPFMLKPVTVTCMFVLPCLMASLCSVLFKKKELFFGSVALTVAVLALPMVLVMAEPIGAYESSAFAAAEIKKHLEPGDMVGAETDYRRGVAFYLDTEDVPDIHKHDKMTKFFNSDKRAWGVIKDKNHRQMYTDDKRPFRKSTYVVWRSGKKALVTNKVPPDGHYLKERSIDDPS